MATADLIPPRRCMLECAWLLALAIIGCHRGENRAHPRGSTVTVAYCCGKEALNPSHDMNAKFLVFLPLLTYNQSGGLEGRLARTWEHSADYREWTYHLRTDIRWEDGVPATANDIAFTVKIMHSFNDLDYGQGAIKSVTVHDDSTVTIRSGHSRLYQTWMVFYPKHLLEHLDPAELANWDFWAHPVGDGPYRFARLVPDAMMEFAANPEYFRGKPRIQRVLLRFSQDAGLTELLSGNVDAITDLSPAHMLRLAKDPRFHAYYRPWETSALAIYWRHDSPFFRDPQVRRALTLAINRRELLRLLNLPDSLPLIDGPFTPRQFRRRDLPDPLPYDPAQAEALLETAGWHRNGDGLRERDGRQFRFKALVRAFSSENTPGDEQAAVYVQSQLRRVGVWMEIETLDPDIIWERFRAGHFEAVFSWLRFYELPWLQRFPFKEGGPLGYKNAELVKLLARGQSTADPDVEDRIYCKLMAIFRADLPVTFLYPMGEVTVAHRRLRGMSSPYRVDPTEHMDDLWLEGNR